MTTPDAPELTSPDDPGGPNGPDQDRSDRSDRSPWNWLLILPIILPLMPFLFNFDGPRIFGFPRFYWLQFLFIAVGVTCTTIVYQMTKRRR